MNFLDLFAQKLREKREQKKITQRELAERLNMCTRTVIEIPAVAHSYRCSLRIPLYAIFHRQILLLI